MPIISWFLPSVMYTVTFISIVIWFLINPYTGNHYGLVSDTIWSIPEGKTIGLINYENDNFYLGELPNNFIESKNSIINTYVSHCRILDYCSTYPWTMPNPDRWLVLCLQLSIIVIGSGLLLFVITTIVAYLYLTHTHKD